MDEGITMHLHCPWMETSHFFTIYRYYKPLNTRCILFDLPNAVVYLRKNRVGKAVHVSSGPSERREVACIALLSIEMWLTHTGNVCDSLKQNILCAHIYVTAKAERFIYFPSAQRHWPCNDVWLPWIYEHDGFPNQIQRHLGEYFAWKLVQLCLVRCTDLPLLCSIWVNMSFSHINEAGMKKPSQTLFLCRHIPYFIWVFKWMSHG